MGVKALYYSERDGLDMALKNPDKMLFSSKADADARDKILELSEEITTFLQRKVSGLSEELAEQCALAIAEEKELFTRALKKPELLNETEDTE
ncbi:YebG family protein [Marinobacter daepoensis]|uniref:YebG family protein n=1 Tax=Marinobacter daepoensis TaxID=262077 RepID=UPI00040FDC84|nr:YebG family protein [Marinobacter daepoensis]MBY6033325.1 YebG family protein [Marinobacter daepoensis]